MAWHKAVHPVPHLARSLLCRDRSTAPERLELARWQRKADAEVRQKRGKRIWTRETCCGRHDQRLSLIRLEYSRVKYRAPLSPILAFGWRRDLPF